VFLLSENIFKVMKWWPGK